MWKSKLYGCDVYDQFLQAAASFMSCRIDRIPFIFMGLIVGGNHISIIFWKPVVDIMKSKLSDWKGRLLSIGGRISLMNSTLSNLLVYNLSFFKIPIKVINEIHLIQRKFLWYGTEEKRGVYWISWESICRSKEVGALGIKDIAGLNKALFSKWLWRFSCEKDATWTCIIQFRYRSVCKRLVVV